MARALKAADRDPLMNPRILEARRMPGFFSLSMAFGQRVAGVAGARRLRALT